jgi:hypothetical protein
MEFRQLGASGLRVPVLNFGTATFGGGDEFFKARGNTQYYNDNADFWIRYDRKPGRDFSQLIYIVFFTVIFVFIAHNDWAADMLNKKLSWQ